jgi:uncharacterized LabA/DUF88 family protein
MDRFAILVDAGFLLAWGTDRRVGARAPRTAVTCDYAGLLRALAQACAAGTSRELLRVYWYDGAVDQVPTADHQAIAREDRVKIRLGRLTRHGQKGVDTLIVLDLTTLARERAVSTAFVMAGDDDLREGVVVAQHLGLRVDLLRLAPTPNGMGRQAEPLVLEADLCCDVTPVVDPFFVHARTAPHMTGLAFGQRWSAQALSSARSHLTALKATASRELPSPLAMQLRTAVRAALGSTKPLQPWQQREAERGFWDAIPDEPS